MAKTLIIGDLTAIFDVRKRRHFRLDYARINSAMQKKYGSFDTNMFTLYDERNSKQVAFVKQLRDIGWKVSTIPTKDVTLGRDRRSNNFQRYRFDSQIGIELVDLDPDYDKVVIISDSFGLKPAVQKVKDIFPEVEVEILFFTSDLDRRWNDAGVSITDLRQMNIPPEVIQEPQF